MTRRDLAWVCLVLFGFAYLGVWHFADPLAQAGCGLLAAAGLGCAAEYIVAANDEGK